MANIYYDRAVRYYDFYTDVLKLKTKKLVSTKESKRRIDLIDDYSLKAYNTVKIADSIMDRLNLNPTIKELGRITFLDHNIGEIYQISKLGIDTTDTFNFIYENNDFNTLIRLQMPTNSSFDGIVKYVISHYKTSNLSNNELKSLLACDLSKLNIYELNSETKIQVLKILLQILQDIKNPSNPKLEESKKVLKI